MQIIFKKEDFLYTIFPELANADNTLIENTLEKYYSYGPFKPIVKIADNWITVNIDTSTIISQEVDYKKVVALCEKGKYTEAKPLLLKISYASMAIYMFHRQIYFVFVQILPIKLPLQILYFAIIVIPATFIIAYFIQKGYDILIEQLKIKELIRENTINENK